MNTNYLNFQGAYVSKKGEMIVSANICNGLFSVKDDGNRYIGSFKNKPFDIQYLHKAVLEYDNMLYFIPTWGNVLDTYNLETGEIGIIIPDYIVSGLTTINVTIGFMIVFIQRESPFDCVTYDIRSGEFSQCVWLNKKLSDLYEEFGGFSFSCAEVCFGKIFLPLRGHNIIAEIELDRKIVRIHKLNITDASPYSINFYNNDAWITQEFQSSIIKWSPHTEGCTVYGSDREDTLIPYIKAFFSNSMAIFVPRNRTTIDIIDMNSGERRHLSLDSMKIRENKNMNSTIYFNDGFVMGDILTLYPSRTNNIVRINTKTWEIQYCNTGNIDVNTIVCRLVNEGKELLREDKMITLKSFIETIV